MTGAKRRLRTTAAAATCCLAAASAHTRGGAAHAAADPRPDGSDHAGPAHGDRRLNWLASLGLGGGPSPTRPPSRGPTRGPSRGPSRGPTRPPTRPPTMPPVAPDPVPETPRPTTGQPTTGEPTTGEPTTGEPTEEVQSDAASTGEPTGSASDAASTGEPTAGSASDAATGEPTAGSGAAGTDAPTGPPQDDADDGGREAFWYREFLFNGATGNLLKRDGVSNLAKLLFVFFSFLVRGNLAGKINRTASFVTDAEGATHTACVNNSEYPQWMADWDADPSNAAGGLEFLFDSEGECCAHPDHECDGYVPEGTGEPSGGPTGSPTEGTADDGEVMWWHGEFYYPPSRRKPRPV